MVEDSGRGLSYLLESGFIAGVAAGEIEHLRALAELLHPQAIRPIRPVIRFLSPGIAHTGDARHETPEIGNARGNDAIRHEQPAQRPHHVDDFDAPGAMLNTVAASGAQPQVFGLERNHAIFCLIDHSARKKLSHTIPRTHRITFSALIAELVGVSAFLFYAFDYHLEGG